MDSLGTDLSSSGSVMTKGEMEEQRRRRGECITCGEKCFYKRMFKMTPINVPGRVLEGRCLRCKPLQTAQVDAPGSKAAPSRSVRNIRNPQVIEKFHQSQKRLAGGEQAQSGRHMNTSYSRSSSNISGGSSSRASVASSSNRVNLSGSNTSDSKPPPVIAGSSRPTSCRAPKSAPMQTTLMSQHSKSYRPGSKQGSSKSIESAKSIESSKSIESYSARSTSSVPKESIQKEEDDQPEKPSRTNSFTTAVYGEMAAKQLVKNFRDSRQDGDTDEEPILNRGGAVTFAETSDNVGHSTSADDDENANEIKLHAGNDVKSILTEMKENPDSSTVQEEAFNALAKLKFDASMNATLATLDGFSTVVIGLKSHPNDIQTQIAGCSAISNISLDSTENQVALVQAGAVDVVLAAITEFDEDSELQGVALVTIGNLAAAAENLPVIVEKGTVEKIVASMNHQSEVEDIQVKGCSAISKMASHESPLKKKILEDGGGGCVVIAMVMHSDTVAIQGPALQVFCDLCHNFDDNIEGLIGVGAIDSAVTAMQAHRDEANVQMLGASVLGTLAVTDESKEIIGDGGGIDVLVRAMWVHSDDIGVNVKSARALSVLCEDIENASLLVEVGGVSAIVNAMQTHADDADLQAYSCGVLKGMAEVSDQIKTKIVEEEAIDAIVMTMVLHGDNKFCQHEACKVLSKLAIEYNIEPMIAANVNELVGMAVLNFPDECGAEGKKLQELLAE